MITYPVNRHAPNFKHASYGIVNWFRKRAIKDEEVMKEVMANFCIENGMEVKRNTKELLIVEFCQKRFCQFAQFAIKFLKENNYQK